VAPILDGLRDHFLTVRKTAITVRGWWLGLRSPVPNEPTIGPDFFITIKNYTFFAILCSKLVTHHCAPVFFIYRCSAYQVSPKYRFFA